MCAIKCGDCRMEIIKKIDQTRATNIPLLNRATHYIGPTLRVYIELMQSKKHVDIFLVLIPFAQVNHLSNCKKKLYKFAENAVAYRAAYLNHPALTAIDEMYALIEWPMQKTMDLTMWSISWTRMRLLLNLGKIIYRSRAFNDSF